LHYAGSFRSRRIDAVNIIAQVVVLFVGHVIQRIPAGGDAVHLRFGIELRHRQISGFPGAAGTDANELPDRDQSATQDGDRQDHLQQG
jgi:hypothetical protein